MVQETPQPGDLSSKNDGIVRFGNFELDPRSGELRNRGRKIKLYGQPFALLLTLLERPGEVVTREELRNNLWASDTFVDFEHGINTTINKLRDTLGDRAEKPRYIETLPRRGYRFIGHIAASAPAEAGDARREVGEHGRSLRTNHWGKWAILSALIFVALAVFGTWLWKTSSQSFPTVLSYRQLTRDGQSKGAPPCVLRSWIVSDGPRVYFSNPSAGLVQVAASGGEVNQVATPSPCFGIADISPDKTELLGFVADNNNALDQPLWSVSLTSGQAHRVGNIVGRAAAWSADGQEIAFAAGTNSSRNQIFVALRDGTNARELARFERGSVLKIRWSPDGTRLRLLVEEDKLWLLWEVLAEGSNLHKIDPIPGREISDAYWTPDSKYSVFVASRDGPGGPDFWMVPEKNPFFGGTVRPVQLTSGALGFYNTAISPDGKHLFGIGSQISRGSLVRFDPISKRLEPFLSGIAADQLDFSRDGKWIVYVSFPDGTLWKCKTDGSQRTQLTQPPLYAGLPHWSPDGRSIVFSGTLSKFLMRIYVVSAEGGEPKVVSEGADHRVNPTWMPDGKALVFGESQFASRPKIHTLDLTTGKESIIPESEGLYDPFASPDGRFILGHDTPGNHRIMLFDVHMRKWSELLDIRKYGFSGIGYPHWSSDGKYVYGTVIRGGTHSFSVYRVNMTTRKVDRVIPFEVPGGTTGVYGPLVKVLPDGSPMILRDLSSQEIYAIDLKWP